MVPWRKEKVWVALGTKIPVESAPGAGTSSSFLSSRMAGLAGCCPEQWVSDKKATDSDLPCDSASQGMKSNSRTKSLPSHHSLGSCLFPVHSHVSRSLQVDFTLQAPSERRLLEGSSLAASWWLRADGDRRPRRVTQEHFGALGSLPESEHICRRRFLS